MLLRLDLKSWVQKILLPQPFEELGLRDCLMVPWHRPRFCPHDVNTWPEGWELLLLSLFFKTSYFLKLHFRFWGTCEEHARLLHRYTHDSVICCLPPLHLYLAFLPMLSPRTVPPLFPPNRPQCVVLPSLCPCVLIVQHLPMSENTPCLIFCSCVSLLRMMFSRFIHVPTKDMNSLFSMAA